MLSWVYSHVHVPSGCGTAFHTIVCAEHTDIIGATLHDVSERLDLRHSTLHATALDSNYRGNDQCAYTVAIECCAEVAAMIMQVQGG